MLTNMLGADADCVVCSVHNYPPSKKANDVMTTVYCQLRHVTVPLRLVVILLRFQTCHCALINLDELYTYLESGGWKRLPGGVLVLPEKQKDMWKTRFHIVSNSLYVIIHGEPFQNGCTCL